VSKYNRERDRVNREREQGDWNGEGNGKKRETGSTCLIRIEMRDISRCACGGRRWEEGALTARRSRANGSRCLRTAGRRCIRVRVLRSVKLRTTISVSVFADTIVKFLNRLCNSAISSSFVSLLWGGIHNSKIAFEQSLSKCLTLLVHFLYILIQIVINYKINH
jgi:hypothetical protein